MNRKIPGIYFISPLVSAAVAFAGIMVGSSILGYWVPAALCLVTAVMSLWRYIIKKENLELVVLYAGTFLFYHFQALTPAYWKEFDAAIAIYSQSAKLLSALGIHFLPLMGLGVIALLNRWMPLVIDEGRAGPQRPSTRHREQFLFTAFILLFGLVAIPNVLYGGIYKSSLDAIRYMRAQGDMGIGIQIETRMSSLLNINHFASSLVVLTVALFWTRYRFLVLILSPLSVLWALGSVFAMGTRTQVVQFGAFFAIVLLGSPKIKKIGMILAVGLAGLVFVLAQVMSFYRTVGLKEVSLSELSEKITEVQGLETMHDQTRAIQMFVDGYSNPAAFGVAPVDFAYGMFYRPMELVLFPVPRSLFPFKPEDPTVFDLNRWVISGMGLDPDQHSWGLTAGLLGRDMLRWGWLGGFVAVFWFSVLCWYVHREYLRDRFSLNQRLVAGAFAGTAMAMFRDLTPLWCLQLLPAAIIIMVSRIPSKIPMAPRTKPGRARPVALNVKSPTG